MKNSFIRLTVLAVLVFLLLSQAACSPSGSTTAGSTAGADAKDHILIGRVVPITGPLASFGSGTPYVEQQAIDFINEELGGIYLAELGRKLPLRLVYADSESSITKASEAAVKLIQEDGIDIMIVSNTADTVRPVAAACERYSVPCISVDAPADVWLAGGPYSYSYHAFFDTENELNSFIDAWELAEGGTLVGLIASDDFEGQEIAEKLPDIAASRGFTVVDPGLVPVGATNYTNIIRQLQDSGCEIVTGVMNAQDFAHFWRQCAEMDYKPQVCTVAKANLFAEDVAALGQLGDGLITEVWWSVDFPGQSSLNGWDARRLGEDYLAGTGLENIPATVGYKHANIELLYDILVRASSLNPEKVVAAIGATDLETLVGRIQFDNRNVCILPCITGQWQIGSDGRAKLNILANTQLDQVPLTGQFRPIPGSMPATH